jgi:hypothetical protein
MIDPQALRGGRDPDDGLVDALADLMRDGMATGMYANHLKQDTFRGALGLGRREDLWRAWLEARALQASFRQHDAFERVRRSTKLHSLREKDDLVELERMVLLGTCLASVNEIESALDVLDGAGQVLGDVMVQVADSPGALASDLLSMLAVIGGMRTPDTPTDDPRALVDAWVIARGVDLVVDIAQLRCQLLGQIRSSVSPAVDVFERDVVDLHDKAGVAFRESEMAKIEFALGNCLTEQAPARAFEHFENVRGLSPNDDGLAMVAAVNGANCLLRLGRFEEAEGRYAALESQFEFRGDLQGAARVWMAENIAAWKARHDPAIRASLVGAIAMFEEHLQPDSDHMSRYSVKRFAESAYDLLVTINATTGNDSDERRNETLGALRAVLSRDQLSGLTAGDDVVSEREELLARASSPLGGMRATLAPHPGVGIIHLVSGVDSIVWILYGFDALGQFRFESALVGAGQSDLFVSVLRVMEAQLDADVVNDPFAVSEFDAQLVQLGGEIGSTWSAGMRELLGHFSHVFYMPDPFGNIDEFPIDVIRLDGAWLGELWTITRSPTFNHLREAISPNRSPYASNNRAVVVLGAPELAGSKLAMVEAEAAGTVDDLGVFGFEVTTSASATAGDMKGWLGGGVGVLHYVGHGVFDDLLAALPLGSGEVFTPDGLSALDGMDLPFIFLCACVAGRVRSADGGYQSGLASRLLERGSPAVLAFLQPIPEHRAYAIAREFRRQAYGKPLGAAVQETRRVGRSVLPSYAWLSLVAYGDPEFSLRSMIAGDGEVTYSGTKAETWDSLLRRHCVWRTDATAAALSDRLSSAPEELAEPLRQWLPVALGHGAQHPEGLLSHLEDSSLVAEGLSDAERLSVIAAVEADRLQIAGYDTLPIHGISERERLFELHASAVFISLAGGALFDMPLNALGNTLLGRIFVAAQGTLERGAIPLQEGTQSLRVIARHSPFVATLRDDSLTLMQHFGH